MIEDLPRNIDRSEVKITVETEEVKVWPIAAVQAVMGFIPKQSERLKLYMLLMLNCGMTQKDISDLEPDQVDWQAHTITRKRSKTQDCKNVPTVTYPLWIAPLPCWEIVRQQDGERVLTNRRGSPLKVVTLMEKVVNVDIIGTMYGKFRKRCQEAGVLTESPTLKMFRKTSHSLIGNAPNDTWATYKVYFLGHAPMTVADKHYFRLDQAEFAKAIQWLGETLGFALSHDHALFMPQRFQNGVIRASKRTIRVRHCDPATGLLARIERERTDYYPFLCGLSISHPS